MGYKVGLVTVDRVFNSVRVRWRFNGHRYQCNPGIHWEKRECKELLEIIDLIGKDISSGDIDGTYNRYKVNKGGKFLLRGRFVKEKFKYWVCDICNGDIENPMYDNVLSLIGRYGDFYLEEFLENFNNEQVSPKTYNLRLYVLIKFFDYLLNNKYIPYNPLNGVKTKRNNKHTATNRLPLSTEEINILLDAIKTDRFVNVNSYYKHSHYYPFLYFIFNTGCRNSEAVGLQVRDIEGDYIHIRSTLSRSKKGTNNAARVRKNTKTGKHRYIPIDDRLKVILDKCCEGKNKKDLVFTSYKGLCIDDRMLQRRVLKPVLEKLGFEDRVLYVARHSFCTIAIESGYTLVEVSRIVGNTPETLMRNYLHLTNKPKKLPVISK